MAEILPPESANCYIAGNSIIVEPYITYIDDKKHIPGYEGAIPCWSLAALLNVMPSEVIDNHFLTLHKEGGEYCCCYENYNGHSIKGCFSDNPIDACVEMILKLKEEGLIQLWQQQKTK